MNLAWGFAAVGVGAEIGYPLLSGGPRVAATVVTVIAFAAASIGHAARVLGLPAAGALLVVAGGGGLAVEAVGVTTGMPFGRYAYAGTLGPEVVGVPLLVGLAWIMLAYPSLVVAQRLARSGWRRALVGGWAMAAWDLFLDPQMVDAGH